MNWRAEDLKAYMTRRLASEQRARERMQGQPITEAQFQSYVQDNATPQGLPAAESERPKRRSLGRATPREAASGTGPAPRFAIRFVVRSRRPMDWDNVGGGSLKRLQDLLVEATRMLPGDGWNVLQGTVISEKAESAEVEGTSIIIEQLD